MTESVACRPAEAKPAALSSALRQTWPIAAAVVVFYVFANAQITAMLSNTMMSGETAVLANVVIDYARDGVWHYPAHAQHLYYPGFEKFIIHPPLHYFLAAQWLKAFGIGAWQIHVQTTLVAVLGILLATAMTRHYFGWGTAILVPALAASVFGFYYSSQQLRCDFSFGLVFGLCVVVAGVIISRAYAGRSPTWWMGLFGALAVAAVAAHWYGYFVQLYLPVLAFILFRRLGGRALMPIVVCALGWLAAMGIWWWAFGNELFLALIIVLIKGNELREVLNVPLSTYLVYITTWPGGLWPVAGIILAVLNLAWSIGTRVTRRFPLSRGDTAALFLTINLAAYFLFFMIFIGNKHPQYGSQIYFLALPLAAYGYARTIERVPSYFSVQQFAMLAACGFAGLVMIGAAPVHAYFSPAPWTLRNPNLIFDAYRDALTMVVPEGRPVVVGGNAYPYLYDRKYTTTMALVGQYFLCEFTGSTFAELIAHYRDMPGKYLRTEGLPIAARQNLVANYDFIVTSDMGHSWQYLFYDVQVWRRDFVELATVFVEGAAINREPIFASTTIPETEKFFTVFVRRDMVASLPARLRAMVEGPPRVITVGERAIIVTYGQTDRHALVDGYAWKKLDLPARIRAIKTYFDMLGWYQANLSETQKDELARSLEARVSTPIILYHGYLYNGVLGTRTMANGIDYAMSKLGVPDVLPRTPIETVR